MLVGRMISAPSFCTIISPKCIHLPVQRSRIREQGRGLRDSDDYRPWRPSSRISERYVQLLSSSSFQSSLFYALARVKPRGEHAVRVVQCVHHEWRPQRAHVLLIHVSKKSDWVQNWCQAQDQFIVRVTAVVKRLDRSCLPGILKHRRNCMCLNLNLS